MSADTPPEIEERYARMIMVRTPQMRVAMCFDMSSGARKIVRRSLEQGGVSRERLADALVDRLYGSELSPDSLATCQARLREKMRIGSSPGSSDAPKGTVPNEVSTLDPPAMSDDSMALTEKHLLKVWESLPKRSKRFWEAIDHNAQESVRETLVSPAVFEKGVPSHFQVEILRKVGLNLAAHRLPDLAELYMRRALELDSKPTSARSLELRQSIAATFNDRNRNQEALYLWDGIIDDITTSSVATQGAYLASAFLHKGISHARLDERRQAMRSFREGLHRTESDARTRGIRGRLLHEIGFGQYQAGQFVEAASTLALALDTKEKSLESDIRSVLATRLMLGLALVASDEVERARGVLTDLIDRDPDTEIDDIRLIATHALATAERSRGNLKAVPPLARIGKAISPRDDEGRTLLLKLRAEDIYCMPRGSPKRKKALKAFLLRIEKLGIPPYAAATYVNAQYGLLQIYIDEGDNERARTFAARAAPKMSRLLRAGLADQKTVDDFHFLSGHLESEGSAVSGLLKSARFRAAFPGRQIFMVGDWLSVSRQEDCSLASLICSQRLAAVAREVPNLRPIEFEFIHDEHDPRAHATMYKNRYLIAICSGALLRIGHVLDASLRSSTILQRWNLGDLAHARIAVVDSNGSRLLDAQAFDPIRKSIRSVLFEIAIDYLLCHELAHILYGHLAFKNEYPDAEHVTLHALEMNADAFAVGQTMNRALARIRPEHPIGNIFATRDMAVETWMLGVYSYLRCIGPMTPVEDDAFLGKHPPRSYRYLINAGIVEARLEAAGGEAKSEIPLALHSLAKTAHDVESALAVDSALEHCDFPTAFSGYSEYQDRLLSTYADVYPDLCKGAHFPLIKPDPRSD